jgi:hypothetical protein
MAPVQFGCAQHCADVEGALQVNADILVSRIVG